MRRRPPAPLVLATLLLPPLLLAHALAPGAAGAQGGPDAAAAAPAPLPSVTLPPELDRVLRDYERAWTGRDPAGLAALFAEDGFVLANNRPPVRGREAIRAAYANAGGGLSLRALAYATSDTVGYIIGAYASGAGAPDAGKFILALRRPRGRGAWQIAADIDNPSQQQRRAPGPPPG
jgi:hypothetical protein